MFFFSLKFDQVSTKHTILYEIVGKKNQLTYQKESSLQAKVCLDSFSIRIIASCHSCQGFIGLNENIFVQCKHMKVLYKEYVVIFVGLLFFYCWLW